MKNSKNVRPLTLSEKLNPKLNINSRTFAIYEQYLKTTTQNLPREQDDSFKESYKLGSNSPITDTTQSIENRPSSSFKLLLIGVIGGLLLSAISIFILNVTGILPALTERLSSLSSDVPAVSTTVDVSAATTTPKVVDPVNKAISRISETDTIDAASRNTQAVSLETTQNLSSDTVATDDKTITTQKPTVKKVAVKEASVEKVSKEQPTVPVKNKPSVVSYEEFRVEAQDTLYRDSKD